MRKTRRGGMKKKREGITKLFVFEEARGVGGGWEQGSNINVVMRRGSL